MNDKTSIFEFGDAKLKAGDIDPLYGACVRTFTTRGPRAAYTLAFVAFDHAGLAAQCVDRGSLHFWDGMHKLVDQTIRGAPRRYYRGTFAHDSVATLKTLAAKDPWKLLSSLAGPYEQAMKHIIDQWPGWGPTAAWKICDMAERVCGVPIDFRGCEHHLISNSQVQKGAEKAIYNNGVGPSSVKNLLDAMGRYSWATKAPPFGDRPCNLQEFETMLCYYSHDYATNKHLPGMDKENIRKELTGYGRLAQKLSEAV